VEARCELSEGALLLLVTFLLINAPNLSLVLASVVQGDAVNCNMGFFRAMFSTTKHVAYQ